MKIKTNKKQQQQKQLSIYIDKPHAENIQKNDMVITSLKKGNESQSKKYISAWRQCGGQK